MLRRSKQKIESGNAVDSDLADNAGTGCNRYCPNMMQVLILIILIILVPIFLIHSNIHQENFDNRMKAEYQANLEFARVVALGFERYVDSVVRQELALGEAILLLKEYSPQQAVDYFDSSAKDFSAIRFIGWVNRDGIITLSNERSAIGLNISHRAYFKKIIGGSEWCVSDLLLPLTGEGPSFVIARGVYNKTRQLQGLMIAVMEPEKIPALTFTVKRFEQGSTAIFDRSGRMVYCYPTKDMSIEARDARKQYDPNLMAALKGKETTGMLVSPTDKVKRICANVPIKSIGWVAMADRPEFLVVEKFSETLHLNRPVPVIVTIISMTLAILIVRKVAYQTRLLCQHAILLGEGNLDNKINSKGIIELCAVGEALNRMSDKIKERNAQLMEAGEEALRSSKELNTIFNTMEQGILLFDASGIVLKLNQSVIEAFGFNPIGQKLSELALNMNICDANGNPLSVEEYPISRSLKGEKCIAERISFRNAQGKTTVILLSSIPLYIDNRITGVVQVWQDVTEREQLMRELRLSEEKYRELIQYSNNMITRLKSDGTIIFLNEYAQKSLGITEAEVIGKHAVGTVLPEVDSFGNDWHEIIDDFFNNPKKYENYEFEVRRSDGVMLWLAVRNRPIYDKNGKITEILSVGLDITDRRQAELALKKSEQRFRRLVESSTYGLILMDFSGKISYANPGFIDMMGYSSKEVEEGTLSWSDLTPPPFKKQDANSIRELKGKGVCSSYEKEYYAKDGQRVPVFEGKTILDRSETGEVTVAVYLIDLTQLKQTQKALRRAYDDLEVRINERTAELVRSNEELTRFAYMASHDLQEPLRMVASYVQMLELRYKDKLDPEANQFIEYAVEGANRMREMIKAILDYSRLNTKPSMLELTDCEQVLSKVLENLKLGIEESNAQITHDKLPTVLADQYQILRVFQNLIENSIKFKSDNRRLQIHISAERKNNHWLFSVRDNGIGIEEEYYDQIFVIFKKLHGQRHFGGTGMGLAIVKRIIERHNGTIYVESTKGEQTTFYFTLPAS